ncbi:glutathione gamma-glutamylcysteinyltransferase-like isoform X1 [Ostrea edulis]|uniref:glutathione gamma-glutamylcysteinyltransferase-like isoform X1 n=1 Tax=Ostrea edulis TaxID=37623 RepID=UPI0024AE9761|nr:glutathione gamma-glutamylcysteinyltransferase-like isoform X1 [Ostrea edulis]XP_048765527.2 glutathione gamma-glutamylcysteinyltransferase-like isoform X1 [Ostrea edulis]XP_048765528.2 glutathione gamma-glutamylcysteinyltransferase-like isoform X1 [Ostrea edulis]XP_048765529.2 glutathione gamma-glutamylcysteinyltransferase-like isoform X1 [Ostrea edulis]XP_048765530.2 glutathione gamma-glutamylcysteinyltransferase-like isoform X1 [Ostrea edulis]XP_048765531.2 glutathione gamma-glutamylcyst
MAESPHLPMAESPQKVPQFYRRVLPQSCISFYSQEGKKIFHEALESGHMECYFKLAAQFRTQDEPAFCGLTTLVIALNALEVDPGEVWKGPWRWFHERMLYSCVPISLVEQEGINFDQFVCLAGCNSLDTQPTKSGTGGTLEQFREKVIEYTKRDDAFLILSYSRITLNQSGDGHFSPVGGYHPEKDLVLMLDTARFKYPPHWIPVELLWDAMHAMDESTGEPRGYLTVTKITSLQTEQTNILALFKISSSFDISNINVVSAGISPFICQWQEWLKKDSVEQQDSKQTLQYIIKNLNNCAKAGEVDETVFTTQIDIKYAGNISQAHACVVHQLLSSIEKTPLFTAVTDFLTHHGEDQHLDRLGCINSKLCPVQAGCLIDKLGTAHFVVMFILSWPYEACDAKVTNNNAVLDRLVVMMLSEFHENILSGESNVLRKQFSSLLKLQKEKMAKRKKCNCHKKS